MLGTYCFWFVYYLQCFSESQMYSPIIWYHRFYASVYSCAISNIFCLVVLKCVQGGCLVHPEIYFLGVEVIKIYF